MIFIKILKKQIIAIAFGDITADMLSNKKLNLIVTELFIKGRKLNISFAFYHSIILYCTKNIGLNSGHYFVMKLPNSFNKLFRRYGLYESL